MHKAKRSTLVAQTDLWRTKTIDGEDLVDFVRRDGDRQVNTRADYIKLLCDGSPALRAICREIHDHVLEGR